MNATIQALHDDGLLTILPTPVILVDLDGTLCDDHHRLSLAHNPYLISMACDGDAPYTDVIELVKWHAESHGARIMFVSGRRHVAWAKTVTWLEAQGFSDFMLRLRFDSDVKGNTAYKEYVVDQELPALHLDPIAFYDDFSSVLAMAAQKGIAGLHCLRGTAKAYHYNEADLDWLKDWDNRPAPRDHRAIYLRRDARARAEGYKSYADKRRTQTNKKETS